MKYRVVLIKSDEGFAVGCPALPGCWSQGETREEALQNIREAIQDVLEVEAELKADAGRAELDSEGYQTELVDVELLAHA